MVSTQDAERYRQFLQYCLDFINQWRILINRTMSDQEFDDGIRWFMTGVATQRVNPFIRAHLIFDKHDETKYLLIWIEKIINLLDPYYPINTIQQPLLRRTFNTSATRYSSSTKSDSRTTQNTLDI